ncbi:hypothetical protein [cf. Phormidesmis sp. LEGE 11477]|uniref:hypothetical protein n=1 Tax=cf. Phormidesmis sp. LEGE 11477 TaxID=1828680 RepID=UPI00187E9DFC|nr:hypothetical protein [cf. Phormidesmis sp. LEGE 11477]MBE9062874.1 hypothetical protein [cf. Phormidesmis sp. LEGE 11477]
MAIQIHFVTGSKGNVGKTAWSEAIVAYYRKKKKSLSLIDGDKEVPALSKTCSTNQIAFSDDPGLSTQPDAIIKLAYAESKKRKGSDVLVDLPAGGDTSLNNWMDGSGVARLSDTYGFSLIKWWVSDSDIDSIQLFKESAERYPAIRHIFLKNMGKSRKEQWKAFDSDNDLRTLLDKCNGAVLDIPRVEPVIIDWLRANKIPLTDVVEDKNFQIADIAAHVRIDTWVTLTEDLISSVMSSASVDSSSENKGSKEQEVVAAK